MRNLEVVQLLGSAHDHMAPLLDLEPRGTTLVTARGVRGEAAAELAVTLPAVAGPWTRSPARDRSCCGTGRGELVGTDAPLHKVRRGRLRAVLT
ncbi:hypothetical protein [Streptomyces sp. NRRL WC-3744]|uniref:hypothetical protein n=1 Tax=Streptomyces sp. NRRL WC-3744 TaxID=1463935 RepID=UPI00131D8F3B|nr:hypothetical protein [Streptomyces sp. NRRL WC-3744]